MAFITSYNASGLLYDSDAEPIDYKGDDYNKLLEDDFKTPGFEELNLVRCLGRGPNMEQLLLFIPSVSARVTDNHDDSIKFAVKKLDKYTNSKFSLIICQTCISWSDSNSYYFVNQWYNMLPKSRKRNLLKVYLVHSGYSTKSFLTFLTPFASAKMLERLECVEELSNLLCKLELNKKNMLRSFPYVVQRAEEVLLGVTPPLSVFGTDMWILAMRLGQPFKGFPLIPPVISNILEIIESPEVIDLPDLLYLQCDANTLYSSVGAVEEYGEGYKIESPNVAVSLFKLFLDTHIGGFIGPKGYITIKNAVIQSIPTEDIITLMADVTKEFTSVQKDCIFCIIKTLRSIARRAQRNKMSLKSISKTLAGSFFRPLSHDPYCFKVIPACEYVLSTMIEKPELFFKREHAVTEKSDERKKHRSSKDITSPNREPVTSPNLEPVTPSVKDVASPTSPLVQEVVSPVEKDKSTPKIRKTPSYRARQELKKLANQEGSDTDDTQTSDTEITEEE